jgi:serine phosphatase RsbU (regulator of sigma subunit)
VADRGSDEQTFAEADQTGSETDQSLSDADQTSADSDQTSADRDQLAADRDQVASDQDLVAGGDVVGHDISQAVRARSTAARERTAARRDQTATARLEAGEQRDAIANARDVAAVARDRAASARDIAMAQASMADAQEDDARALTAAARIVRAAEQRTRAARQRLRAAQQRALAAVDRLVAQRDREEAARERRRSLDDRQMFAVELRRERGLRIAALDQQHRAERLARTLQLSLSPPSLPSIDGLDVAVHYEPSAPEDVGGDFYDLFALADSRSGFFLGDVCGKGPEAAAVTSLARYTMRTAAMLHEKPDAILLDLNAALLAHDASQTPTCTAVYGQIDLSTAAAALTLAVAGHPAPIIVRRDGSTHAASAHGTMLGAVEQPTFRTCEVTLGLGDAVVICSDGILDTHLDGRRADEQRIAQLLAGSSEASAQDLVDRLTHALDGVDRPLCDDVAILALRRTPPAAR